MGKKTKGKDYERNWGLGQDSGAYRRHKKEKGKGDDRHFSVPLLCAHGVTHVNYSCCTWKDGDEGMVTFEKEERRRKEL